MARIRLWIGDIQMICQGKGKGILTASLSWESDGIKFRGFTKMVDAVAGELGAGFAHRKRGFVCWIGTQGVALGWDGSPRWGEGLYGDLYGVSCSFTKPQGARAAAAKAASRITATARSE